MSTRDDVLELLQRSENPLRPSEVATRLALGYERTKKAMQRMARAGELTVEDGRYSVPPRDRTARHGDMEGVRVRVIERDAWEESPRWWIA